MASTFVMIVPEPCGIWIVLAGIGAAWMRVRSRRCAAPGYSYSPRTEE